MPKKRDNQSETKPQDENTLNRRDFVKAGVAAGVGTAALVGAGAGTAQAHESPADIQWDHEANVIVCGSGGTGIVAAKRAHDLCGDVLVIEQNFDVGGRLSHNGGWSTMGGGDPVQERDRLGLADPDGFVTGDPLHTPDELTDDPDLLFRDTTDWSVVNDAAIPEYRYNDRNFHRGWADNAPLTRQFLSDNYVRWTRINGTHQGGGMTRARAPYAMMKLGDVTDIEAGTITTEDAGSWDEERQSPFNPQTCFGAGARADPFGAPDSVFGGFVISRSVEYSARKAGVRFMMNRHLDEIIRDGESGRIIGVKASYTPRFSPSTGERLESYWTNGNIDETKEVIYIRARRGVVVGTGGYMGNVPFRTAFDPRLSGPELQYGDGLCGPLHQDASGILAGMKVGASLGGLLQSYRHTHAAPRLQNVLAVTASIDRMMPGHPAFEFMGSHGISIGGAGWEYIIAVNQVGQRFFDEWSIGNERGSSARFPAGDGGTRNPFTALDWRNASVEHIRSSYDWGHGSDAAMAMNEGSRAPDYASGPTWAIFDQAAVDANDWPIRYPYIADPPNGTFFQADTIAELAQMVVANQHQRMPLRYLEETVARFNGFADAGQDEDFEKETMHRISQPPFYAALIPLGINDTYGGLRIDGHAQVIDIYGNPIPGLFAGGEASGGGQMHGIGRACITGFMAGTYVAAEPAA